jgi:fructokinase
MDDAGKEILHRLELAGFNLDDMQIDDVHPTGSVKVKLDKSGAPQFDIISEVAYDYIKFIPEYHANLINKARIIYFGSLVQRTEAGCKNLQAFISHKQSKKLNFYDINLRPGCYSSDIIEKSLLKTDILKLSAGELEKLRQMRSLEMENEKFVRYLMETHSIQTVSVTKGERGSELFTNRGSFSADSADVIKVVDSVGAGDAYAAMLAAGMLKNWSTQKLLERASLFASRICEIKGAIPESSSFYEPFKPLFGSS